MKNKKLDFVLNFLHTILKPDNVIWLCSQVRGGGIHSNLQNIPPLPPGPWRISVYIYYTLGFIFSV